MSFPKDVQPKLICHSNIDLCEALKAFWIQAQDRILNRNN